MQAGIKGALDCIKAFSETHLTDDLKKIDIPVLVAHGDDDQIVPIAVSGLRTAELLASATLKVYPGRPTRASRSCSREPPLACVTHLD